MLTDTKYKPIYRRGEIVYDRTDLDAKGEPTYKKLWVWESKHEPFYPKKSKWDSNDAMLYTLKDGPGEKANDVGPVGEEDLYEDFPKEEVPLIDL